MGKMTFSIVLTTAAVFVYVLLTTLPVSFAVVFLALVLCQGLLIWMVISILKDKTSTRRTFEQYYYDDADIRSDG